MVVCVNQWPETSLHQGLTCRVPVTQVQPREGLSRGLATLQQGGLLKGCERIEIARVEWHLSGMPLWLRLSCSTFMETLMTCSLSAMCKKDCVPNSIQTTLLLATQFAEPTIHCHATGCAQYILKLCCCSMHITSLKYSATKMCFHLWEQNIAAHKFCACHPFFFFFLA